jgi:zona occludens toxin (predicted ATPase)
MITLTTGQPGAGKTLWTISQIKQLAEKEKRPVYYTGIQILKPDVLPWAEIKPEDWHKQEQGAIIVIDEAQRLFRPRGNGTAVPDYEAALETHRHKGHDLFIITQHPMLVSTNVRRLIGRHWHVQRTFGMQRATVHEFPELKVEPDKSREGSIRHEWSYPAEAFTWYKSAEVHTHKRRIPMRVYMLGLIPVVLGVLGWFTYDMLTRPDQILTGSAAAQIAPQAASVAPPGARTAPAPMTTKDYIASYQPRITEMPWTAPRYDQVLQVKNAPVLMGCMASSSKCQCYTRQGTPIDIEAATCRKISREGFFDEYRDVALTDYPAQHHKQADELDPPQVAPVAREGTGVWPPSTGQM